MTMTPDLLSLVVVLTVVLIIWRWWHFSYFRRLGIPGPQPSLLWGNLAEYHSTDLYRVIGKWLKKYGDTFGFYNGDVPFVVTCDFDLIEEVCVRNFKNFMNRGMTMAMFQRHPYMGRALLNASTPLWKGTRGAVAGGFTSAKLKQMMPELEDDVSVFLKSLEQHADTGKEVHMMEKYEPLAMDLIARRSLGTDPRFQDDPGHEIFELIKSTAYNAMTGTVHMLSQCVASLGPFMMPLCFCTFVLLRSRHMRRKVTKIIENRINNPKSRKPDVLQNLLEAKYVDRVNGSGASNGEKEIPKSRPLTLDEVLISAASLCLAGFETMTTSMSYVTYTLAKHPDVQEKVREEVIEAVREQGTLDYDIVMRKLNYLEQVMNETLRLYPPGLTFVTRTAEKDFEYKGIKFKAGTCFMVPIYQIHTDPRFWPNPMEFNPDRFSPENEDKLNKRAYVAFGIGPRNCVGMKVAILNLKYTIAKLVLKYSFELGPSQMGQMWLDSHAMVSEPNEGPWVILSRAKA